MRVSLNPDLNYSIGALEAAVNVSSFLLGCVTIQAYNFYRSFPNDPLAMKLLVAGVWLIELASHITGSQTVYRFTVTEWGKPLGLLIQPPALVATVYLTAVITPLVESFYLYRVYRFAGVKSVYFVGAGAVIVWIRFAGWVFLAVQVEKLGIVDGRFLDRWSWLVTVQLSVGASMDAIISSTIVYFLWQRRGTGIQRSVNGTPPGMMMDDTNRTDRQARALQYITSRLTNPSLTSGAFLVTLATFQTMEDSRKITPNIMPSNSEIVDSDLAGTSSPFVKDLLELFSGLIQKVPDQMPSIPLTSWQETWPSSSVPALEETPSIPSRHLRKEYPIIDIQVSKEVLRIK
uniref:Uncharacterized protein n=1 Tax=Moniliophthora roreri TaxID=221103 RepID=A0A0W0GBB7_MONRR